MKPYLKLVAQVRDAVREKAQEVPVFKETGNGAIRILAYPLCKEADEWLGGLSDFSDPENPDIVDYEHTFAISAGGSRVITGVYDGVEQTVDCYAFSALKIAHCSHAQDLGAGLISGLDLNNPYLTEDNGYGPHKGALCVEVQRLDEYDDTDEIAYYYDYCGIYICVSGADSESDLECAKAGVNDINDFFCSYSNVSPSEMPDCSIHEFFHERHKIFRLKTPDYDVFD